MLPLLYASLFFCSLTFVLLFSGCGGTAAEQKIALPDDGGEMTGQFSGALPDTLFVDPSTVKEKYQEFKTKLKALGGGSAKKRPLYEEYVPIIGANGVLAGITELWPTCHSEAHDLGKVIEASVGDIDTALRICCQARYYFRRYQ